MASAHISTRSLLSSFLPRLSASTRSSATGLTTIYSRQLSLPLLPALGFTFPSATQLNLPGFVEGVWESILRAVPKKKTSHMKKRHRQYAGKALKDLTALNKCSACGNIKRAHYLCPYCVNEIKSLFNSGEYQSGTRSLLKKIARISRYEQEGVASEEKRAAPQEKPVGSAGTEV